MQNVFWRINCDFNPQNRCPMISCFFVFLPETLKQSFIFRKKKSAINKCWLLWGQEVSVYSYITGNCLYSCVSLVLVGDNSLTKPFRILTSLELFLHANFYSKHHPVSLSTFSKHKDDIYKCFNNLLLMCVPFHVVDSGLQGDDLIIMDSISNSQDKCWSGFLLLFLEI